MKDTHKKVVDIDPALDRLLDEVVELLNKNLPPIVQLSIDITTEKELLYRQLAPTLAEYEQAIQQPLKQQIEELQAQKSQTEADENWMQYTRIERLTAEERRRLEQGCSDLLSFCNLPVQADGGKREDDTQMSLW